MMIVKLSDFLQKRPELSQNDQETFKNRVRTLPNCCPDWGIIQNRGHLDEEKETVSVIEGWAVAVDFPLRV